MYHAKWEKSRDYEKFRDGRGVGGEEDAEIGHKRNSLPTAATIGREVLVHLYD